MYNFFTVTILRFVSIYFVLSVLIASYFYPGGNIHDPLQIGYSFTHNFLSDLGVLDAAVTLIASCASWAFFDLVL